MNRLAFILFCTLYFPICILAGTDRVSESSDGIESNYGVWGASISSDGQSVVFASEATNLVPEDDNGAIDVFLHDRSSGTTTMVSVGINGAGANGFSGWPTPMISGNSRYVVFTSVANNLVSGDNNGHSDIFIFDRETGYTERVSIDSNGNEANHGSGSPNISSDGRFVTFTSRATNLVSNDVNEEVDAFLHDRVTGETKRVSVASDGTQANGSIVGYWGWINVVPVSNDGRFVAFNSPANNLVPGDTNGEEDVFIHDVVKQTTERISVTSDGIEANGLSLLSDMSDDGRYVLFLSNASNLATDDDDSSPDLFVHDRTDHKTWPIVLRNADSVHQGWVWGGCMSGNGQFVGVIASIDTGFPNSNGSHDFFVYEMASGRAFQANTAHDGDFMANGGMFWCRISDDGRYITFTSSADNLISDDHNNESDVFVIDNPALFQINPGLNGAWFNPETRGQGFFIDVLSTSGLVFASWNTFDVEHPDQAAEAQLGDPGQRWFSAQGPYSGNLAVLDVHSSKGGLFDSAEPRPVHVHHGEMLMEFTSCRSGLVTYQFSSVDQGGAIPVQRVALDNATECESQNGQIQTD